MSATVPPDAVPSYDEMRDLAVRVAREAADLVRERRRAPVEVAAVKTSDIDVVTEADRAAESLVRDRLATLRPGDGVLGEEAGETAGEGDSATGVRWIVDPIDGTVNFLYDLDSYAVSLAAEVDGEVVAGAVVDVAHDRTYEAVLGGGSRRDGQALAVRGPAPLSERLLATGFSYDRTVRVRQAEAWTRLFPLVRDLRRRGSAALDICLVAEGRVDGYLEEGVNPWDHAAAGLVAREAGATTRVVPGAGGLDLMVCAPAHGFDELFEAAARTGFLAE